MWQVDVNSGSKPFGAGWEAMILITENWGGSKAMTQEII